MMIFSFLCIFFWFELHKNIVVIICYQWRGNESVMNSKRPITCFLYIFIIMFFLEMIYFLKSKYNELLCPFKVCIFYVHAVLVSWNKQHRKNTKVGICFSGLLSKLYPDNKVKIFLWTFNVEIRNPIMIIVLSAELYKNS